MSRSSRRERELEDWMARYQSELHAHVTRMLGSRDDADDLIQAVWVKAYLYPVEAEARQNIRAWLYRVATNAALDRIGVERRRARLLEDHGGSEPSLPSLDPPWLSDAGRRRVRDSCMRLPRKQRDAVWHRWIEQEDYETVARRVGSSVEAARVNVYHGLKRLRRELEDLWSQENER